MNSLFVGLLTLTLFSGVSGLFAEKKEPIVNYAVYFSPEEHVAEKLIALIDQEQKSIQAAVYCLMHHGIAQALIRAHQRGIAVEIIIDRYSIREKSPVKRMAAAKVPIFVWDPPTAASGRKALMHDKFCILGNEKVWTGSFNFTREASIANQENVILLENKQIAQRYTQEFDRLKHAGVTLYADYIASHK